jgi:hypothetical protein
MCTYTSSNHEITLDSADFISSFYIIDVPLDMNTLLSGKEKWLSILRGLVENIEVPLLTSNSNNNNEHLNYQDRWREILNILFQKDRKLDFVPNKFTEFISNAFFTEEDFEEIRSKLSNHFKYNTDNELNLNENDMIVKPLYIKTGQSSFIQVEIRLVQPYRS